MLDEHDLVFICDCGEKHEKDKLIEEYFSGEFIYELGQYENSNFGESFVITCSCGEKYYFDIEKNTNNGDIYEDVCIQYVDYM